MSAPANTPMMAQWQECKTEAKEALLFFRLGDFYEAFYEDAHTVSKELGLTLTARHGIAMCGVPFHTAEGYIDKLVGRGFKVAVAEQMEDPAKAKGIVRRQIVRIVTPGTVVNSELLKEKKNNFFASIAQIGSTFGLSYLDVATGDFRALELETQQELTNELCRLRPAEILVGKRLHEANLFLFQELSHCFSFLCNQKEPLDIQMSLEVLQGHFDVHNLDGFGLRGQSAAAIAAGSLLLYLKEEVWLDLEHVRSIQTESLANYMSLDRSALRNLELTESMQDGSTKNTLLSLLDFTATPMGGRLLRHWIEHPLLSIVEIERRQDAIARMLERAEGASVVRALLDSVRDLERLVAKIALRCGSPRDVLALGLSLSHIPKIREQAAPFYELDVFDAAPLSQSIVGALSDAPPLRLGEGDVFRDGYNPELDRLRGLSRESMSWMANYQTQLREQTGIKSLKVGYTKAFGYYIEVSRVQSEKIPPLFQRRQTLVNAERFITEELRQFEHQVLTAEERSRALEAELFEQLRLGIVEQITPVKQAAVALARLDALLSLARSAEQYRFNRPLVDLSDRFEAKEVRHPIVEAVIGCASFIPNDVCLNQNLQMMLITGPNMAGKSTYIRQVALLAILAQIGSYVPAASAHIGLIDKVFSRIGASDDLARGQSTFMVEMSETANILNNATNRSLVLLDEIGRGTSTYDGISIAWAVAEYLLTSAKRQAKTLFATHYWELTRLTEEHSHVQNFQTAVEETPSGIVFLRKIVPGGTDKSYGIHVAKLAGLPYKVVRRAEEMLAKLETKMPRKKMKLDEQLPLFPSEPAFVGELKQIHVDALSPLQALQKIAEWQATLK